MKRTATVAIGAVAALGFFVADEAFATHTTLTAAGQGTSASPVEATVTAGPSPALSQLGDPLILFGQVTSEAGQRGGSFVHQFNFGFNTEGPAGASATPNVVEVLGEVRAGFDLFGGRVEGPGLPSGGVELRREGDPQLPRLRRIFADFAALDTSGETDPTPYTLTIEGSLFGGLAEGVTAGNYSGNVAVVPLPAAGLLFLTAIGGLALVRWFRGGTQIAET